MIDTDGNLAALRQYEREQDALDAADRALEQAQADFADDLYDAYVTGNNLAVTSEVEDSIISSETALAKMQKAMLQEFEDKKSKGGIAHKAYMQVITEACEEIAERCEDLEHVDDLRGGLGL